MNAKQTGAMKAAERIVDNAKRKDDPGFKQWLISVIESETHCGGMLVALEEINGLCDNPKLPYGKEVVRIAREAIAKAKGE